LRAFLAGIDIKTPDSYGFMSLLNLVKSGKILVAMLGESVNRILTSKFRMDLFDDPYVDTNHADQFTGNAKMRAIALKAARQSKVLLKMKEISCLWINQKLKKWQLLDPMATNAFWVGIWL